MGVNNRQRRRAKQAKRRQHQGDHRSEQPSAPLQDWLNEPEEPSVEDLIWAATGVGGTTGDQQSRALIGLLTEDRPGSSRADRVAAVLTRLMAQVAGAALRHGWEPQDLGQFLRRNAGNGAAEVVGPALAVAVQRSASAAQRRPWEEQLSSLGAVRRLDPQSRRWSDDVGLAVAALRLLARLPVLPDLRSLGRPSTSVRSAGDERIFSKVRALLAKAESSEFAEESDALMAKAQELITRHSLDRTLVEARDESEPSSVGGRRCWLDDPYLPAKGLLLATVAEANRCRAVASMELGFVTLVGHPDDIDAAQVLFTSLLVQGLRRMTVVAADARQQARSRRPAYRRSFLVAFATRIGTRLEAAAGAAVQAAAKEVGERLLPVLAQQRDQVEGTVRELFPDLHHQRFSATDLAGWTAGTAAADLADLGARTGSAGRTEPEHLTA